MDHPESGSIGRAEPSIYRHRIRTNPPIVGCDMMELADWKTIHLCGAGAIARVCGVYEITEIRRIPGGKFKIKVLERDRGDFAAFPNVSVKNSDGSSRGTCGLGADERAALQDAVKWFMSELDKRAEWAPEDFEWSDPLDF
jgi:hypothetical protein